LADLLVDTDVLIDHLRGARRLERPAGRTLHASVITQCELYAGPARQQQAVARLLEALELVPVDQRIARAAGEIRRASGAATPDALIAATAIASGLDLLTRNRRDFARIDGLALADDAA
jgi:predicted nucleic acid-binding protein